MDDTLFSQLGDAPVGTKIWFERETQGYTVQARSKRYLVCTKPFNPRRTVLYTIIDLKQQIRGPENLVFGMGAETRQQCEEMIDRLEGKNRELQTEVTHRNRVELDVVRLKLPSTRSPA